jgi:hypothetical protein
VTPRPNRIWTAGLGDAEPRRVLADALGLQQRAHGQARGRGVARLARDLDALVLQRRGLGPRRATGEHRRRAGGRPRLDAGLLVHATEGRTGTHARLTAGASH